MENLFTSIRDKLKADVPEMKYFDWDYGQFDGDGGTPPNVPAVLMDIENMAFSHGGRGMDYADINIVLSCGFRIRGRSDSNAPEIQSQNALDFLATLKKIGEAVDGLRSFETGPLQREGLDRVQVPGLNVYEYRFSATYYEANNLTDYATTAKPPLSIE